MQDKVTGLATREAFVDLVGRALDDPARRPLAVVRLRPNDRHFLDDCGCYDSDAIISDLAARIASCLRPDDHLARVDELTFAVLTPADRDSAVRLTREIMFAVEAPSERQLPLSLAAGIALAPDPDDPDQPTAAGLVQRSSIALGAADAPWRITVFTPQMVHDHAMQRRLRKAITQLPWTEAAADVDVLFEPVVQLATGTVAGIAARAAWRDDDVAISAGRLIAMARYSGLAGQADQLVMQTAATNVATWTANGSCECGRLWVTLCTETLSDEGFPQWLQHLLDDVGLAPTALVVDPLDDLYQGPHGHPARRTLRQIRALGVQVTAGNAMAVLEAPADDRGRAGVDYLSISPTAVERCVDDPRARQLVLATVEIAADHHAATAARQVATAAQHDQLRKLGCQVARGPLYGEPLAASAASELIATAAGEWRLATALRTGDDHPDSGG